MGVDALYTGGYEGIAELYQADLAQQAAVFRLQVFQDFCQGKQFVVLACGCGTEMGTEEFFLGMYLIECLVVALDFLLFPGGEPIAFAILQLGFQLGIDLGKVQIGTIDAVLYLDAEETTASGGIVQQVAAVARADEGGDAGQRGIVGLIGLADVEGGELHQVLQLRHPARGEAVELIEVDQAHDSQLVLQASVGGKIHLVGVVGLQHFGHQTFAERRFQPTLFFTDEQGSHTIGKGGVLSHPLGSQRQHPSVEILDPMGLCGDSAGEVRQTVGTVPCGELLQVEQERMVGFHQGGMYETGQVAIPTGDAHSLHLDAQGVQLSLAQRTEGFHPASLGAILIDFRQEVVAEVVMGSQIRHQLLRGVFSG